MKRLIELFLIFARIGGFTFGGGYAMLPLMQKELVEKRNWVSEETLSDYYAIGQVTPGIIAVNTATFIGYSQKGILGAIAATLGMITPSILIILGIAMFFNTFMEEAIVGHLFAGIRLVVVALIAHTVYKMARKSSIDYVTKGLFWLSLIVLILYPISPVWVVLLGGVVGILFYHKQKEDKR